MNQKETAKNETIETKNRQKEAFLVSLERGSSISESCEAAHVSRATIWRWRKRSKGFNNKTLSILDSRTQSVEDALYASALKGNVVAQIFWLKNRASDRWKDVKEVGVSVEFTFANLMKLKKEQEQGLKNNRIPSR